MTTLLDLLYSLPFSIGMVMGVVMMKAYKRVQCHYADAHRPLPGGRHRHPPSISRVWIGGLLTVAVLGYVILQVNTTEQRYKSLSEDVRHCQVEFQQALVARAKITTENDALLRQRVDLLQEYGRATSTWLGQLVAPPSDLADLAASDPKVGVWMAAVTRVYSDRANRITAHMDAIGNRLEQLEQDRLAHPLPSATCGT